MDGNLNVVLSIGSNCGPRHDAVEEAMAWLSGLLDRFMASDIYETDAIGHEGPKYMNAVASGVSSMTLEELEACCKRYEREFGRDDLSRIEKRVPIDIDIVVADGRVLRPRDFNCEFFRRGYMELVTPQYLEALR